MKNSIEHLKLTGAIAPSSRFLCKKIVELAKINKAKLVIEFGAGTGAITKEILKNLPPISKLLAFEINPDFANFLAKTITDPRLTIITKPAEDCKEVLDKMGLPLADSIISGIPLSNFSKEQVKIIVESAKDCLKPGGEFAQFQYSLRSHRILKKVFGSTLIKFEYRNIPPAFIYHCQNSISKSK